ncbi:hypothetical protein Y1Q_0004358 [Alligator mississippiensis]|uniref:Uncharacterized protein n=1 Tax=Alligator mississippiensis TaxID=8496 RepID=A0A151MIW8_ALLMI|nr:hypothetical protein Y1Q_0004358 [Alligator mississippiensis]
MATADAVCIPGPGPAGKGFFPRTLHLRLQDLRRRPLPRHCSREKWIQKRPWGWQIQDRRLRSQSILTPS